ncbi:DUF4272 domain-containing protein [Massilia sp. TWP1-3-3]|uniref:DUF4272 domain-containing protein n=1 Tax=Massilia sp. TWP1-3-3 TaxID=2804573 RepID=UPI003CE88CF7
MFGFFKKFFTLKVAVPAPPEVMPVVTPVPVTSATVEDDLLINAYCSVNTLPALDFPHTVQGRRDGSDPALKEHLRGFAGWVRSLANGAMTPARYAVLRHLQKVRHHVSILVHPSHMDRYSAWALQANAIAFLPSGFICDPATAVLLSPDGADDNPQACVPYPQAAHQRKARTEALLANRNLTPAPSLPPVIAESEVVLRSAGAVAERLMALFAVAVRAESVASKSPMPGDEIMHRLGLADTAFSAQERKFMADTMPTQKDTVKFGWCYECAYTLAWAAGVFDKLPFPAAICDVELIAQTLLKLRAAGVHEAARLRPVAQLLDCLDLHQRLHWITRQAQADKQATSAGLEAGVIQERHRALNWLVQFEDAAWDDVDTPT